VHAVRGMRGVHLPHSHSAGCLPGKDFPRREQQRAGVPCDHRVGADVLVLLNPRDGGGQTIHIRSDGGYQLLMQSYTANIGHLVEEPWIVMSWDISNQDLSNNTGLVRLSVPISMCRAISPISRTTSSQTSITSHSTCR